MTSDNNPLNTLSGLAPALYEDIARPSARHLGSAIGTVFKIGLSPIKLLDWGFEQSTEWLKKKYEARLESVPKECRINPPLSFAVAAVTQISLSSDKPEVQELFAELLLKAMDSRSSPMVHPAYVSILSELSPHEALVFIGLKRIAIKDDVFSPLGRVFIEFVHDKRGDSSPATVEEQFAAHCQNLGLGEGRQPHVWLGNLQRLSLLKVVESSRVGHVHNSHGIPQRELTTTSIRTLSLTAFGEGFLDSCTPPGGEHVP